jgi:hypothetical protein
LNKTVFVGLVFLLTAPQAWSAPTGIDAAFGNTIVSTFPDGREGKLWLEPDGTYTGEGRRHDTSSGGWTLKGGDLCIQQHKPIPVPFNYCTPIPNTGVGSHWNAKSVFGDPIVISVVAGR